MATPITWRNVDAPNFSSSNQLRAMGEQSVNNAINSFQQVGQIFSDRFQQEQQEEKSQLIFDLERSIDQGEEVDLNAFSDMLNADDQRGIYQYARDKEKRDIQEKINRTTLELNENSLNQAKALSQNGSFIVQTVMGYQAGEFDSIELRSRSDKMLADGVPADVVLNTFGPLLSSAQEQEALQARAQLVSPLSEVLNKVSTGAMSYSSGLAIYNELIENNNEFRLLAATDPETWGRESYVKRLKENEEIYQELGVVGQQVLNASTQRLDGIFEQRINELDAEQRQIEVDTNFGESQIAFNYMDQINNASSLEEETRRIIREAGGNQAAAGEVINIISAEADNLHPAAMAAIVSSVIGENATRGTIASFFTGAILTNEGRLAVRQAVNRHASQYANLKENYAAYSQRMLDLEQRRSAVESSRESALNALKDSIMSTRDTLRDSGEILSAREERELLLRASDNFVTESLPSMLNPTREAERNDLSFNNEVRQILQTDNITPDLLNTLSEEKERMTPDNLSRFNEILARNDINDLPNLGTNNSGKGEGEGEGEGEETVDNLTSSFSEYITTNFNNARGSYNDRVSLDRNEMSGIKYVASRLAEFYTSGLGAGLGAGQSAMNYISKINDLILKSPNAITEQEIEFSKWLVDNRPDLISPDNKPNQANMDKAWMEFRTRNGFFF